MADIDQKATTPTPPDKAAYDEQLAKLEEGLVEASSEANELQAAIDAQENKSEESVGARNVLLNEFRSISVKKVELEALMRSERLQLRQLDKERMDIRRNIQSTRRELKYADLKSFNKGVSHLQKKSKDNAEVAAELQSLQSQRPLIVLLESIIKEEETNEKKSEELRKSVEKCGKEFQKIRKQENALNKKLDSLNKREDNKELKALLSKHRKAVESKKKIIAAKATLQKNFHKEEQKYKKAVARQKRAEARKNAPSKKVEETKVEPEPVVEVQDPYEEHKFACAALLRYLGTLLPPEHKAKKVAEHKGRASHNSQFKGAAAHAVAAPKPEENFFTYGGRKKKKKRKNRRQKTKHKSESLLSHPHAQTVQFALVEVSPPLYASEVVKTIPLVEERAKYYETAPSPQELQAQKEAEEKQEVEEQDDSKPPEETEEDDPKPPEETEQDDPKPPEETEEDAPKPDDIEPEEHEEDAEEDAKEDNEKNDAEAVGDDN